jgi:hypothetical protein
MNETVAAPSVTTEKYFTPEELSNPLKLDPTTIRKMFMDEPGVIRIGHPTTRKRGNITRCEFLPAL